MQMNRLPVAAALMLPLLFTAAVPDTVQRFEIDRNHSRVGFAVRHMGVATVRGEFREFEGHLLLNSEDITQSTAQVVIQTATIDTGNERRDNHLRSDDFFNAERFPTITFDGRRVEQTGDGYALVGDLTIRDVTKEVRIPFELNGPITLDGRQRLGAEGEVEIDRKEFNLLWNNMVEGISVVSDDVRIELAIEAATPRPQS
ncbi:MAG TPA: YceI family protein [Longimicrobiales bacterium]|nr:YceI family protein [Longimicrobiales bacterium]